MKIEINEKAVKTLEPLIEKVSKEYGMKPKDIDKVVGDIASKAIVAQPLERTERLLIKSIPEDRKINVMMQDPDFRALMAQLAGKSILKKRFPRKEEGPTETVEVNQ